MDSNTEIANKASVITEGIPYTWNFTPTADLYVNDKDLSIWMGNIVYAHPAFEIPVCMKVKSWLFTMEQNIQTPNKDTWFVGAFRSRNHYTFGSVTIPHANESTVQESFIQYCLRTFVPLLYPEDASDSFYYSIVPHTSQASSDEVKPDKKSRVSMSEN